jgi:hypothetical protein
MHSGGNAVEAVTESTACLPSHAGVHAYCGWHLLMMLPRVAVALPPLWLADLADVQNEESVRVQVEYHYYQDSNITKPREMLDVLKGLMKTNMRVFNVEPNYWWHNWAHEFIEFAYLQVGPSYPGLLDSLLGFTVCGAERYLTHRCHSPGLNMYW